LGGHIVRIASGLCVAAFLGSAAHAQEPLSLDLGGAEGCAAAKQRAAQYSRDDRPARSAASSNIDITWYSLDIDLDFDSLAVSGIVRVDGRVTDTPMSQLTLDLSNNMVVSGVRIPGGQALTFSHAGDALTIDFPATISVGMMASVEVTYGGIPVPTGFGSFSFGNTFFGVPYAWSLSEPYGARDWWPCKDHPSDKADSVRVAITVPDSMMAGSQGLLRSTVSSGGRTTYEWASTYPITSYLVSVAAGDYVRYTTTYTRPDSLVTEFGPLMLPVEHFRYNDGTPDLPEGWAKVDDAFAVLENWFGPYPFAREKYGHAEFTFFGGMEHQTISSMGSSAPAVVVHELAHQWYGDSVSPRTWPHVWLNEGFATHAEMLLWEALPDSFAVGLFDAILASRRRVSRWAEGTLVLSDTSSVFNMFDGTLVYAKGAMVLRMLRSVVGDTVFRDVMRAYAADPIAQYGTATTDDFQRIAEAQYGASLETFFRQWVREGTGFPVYRMTPETSQSGGGWTVHLTLQQAQTLPESNTFVFEMPVTIAVKTLSGEERFTVVNNQRWQVFTLSVGDEPTEVVFDPDGMLLRNDDVVAAAQPAPRVPVVDAIVPNPASVSAAFRFHNPTSGNVTFVMFDVAGRRVATFPQGRLPDGPGEVVLPTAGLPSGVYFVRLETALGSAVSKLVIVR